MLSFINKFVGEATMSEERNDSMVEKATNTVKNAAQSTTNYVQNTIENVTDAAGNLANRTQDATQNLVNQVMDNDKENESEKTQ
jgi:phage-related protein